MPPLPAPLSIAACGLASSLGHDVVTACAAARAGVSRSTQVAFPLRSLDAGEEELAIGHPVPLVTEGFEGPTRLRVLLRVALADLARRLPRRSGAIAFYLVLPDPARRERWYDVFAPEEKPDDLEDDDLSDDTAAAIFVKALEDSRFPYRAELREMHLADRTGFVEVLERASSDLHAENIGAAVVGAVDSLLDEVTLAALARTLRLKTSEDAAGLQPGEAAALIALDRELAPQAAGSRVQLTAIELARDDAPERGAGLARVLAGVGAKALWSPDEPAWLVTDHSGEAWAGDEWGRTLQGAASLVGDDRGIVGWHPAASFGDTGVASGAVAACAVVRALERGYAPSHAAAMIVSDTGPARGGFAIRGPERKT